MGLTFNFQQIKHLGPLKQLVWLEMDITLSEQVEPCLDELAIPNRAVLSPIMVPSVL